MSIRPGQVFLNVISLVAPIKVIGSENVPAIPLNSELEERYLPNSEKISKEINKILEF